MEDLQFKPTGTDSGTRSTCAGEPLARLAYVKDHCMHIQLDDIPEEMRIIAEELGLESFLKLVKLCSGRALYIPVLASLCRNARDREIRSRFTGGNYNQLAGEFALSARQIRKIINERRS